MVSVTGAALIFFLGLAPLSFTEEYSPPNNKHYWSMLGGGGFSFRGWGSKERVATIDYTIRYNRAINRNLGKSWFRFMNELWIEFPIMEVFKPDSGFMVSLNFISGMIFKAEERFNPYFYFGGGPFFTTAAIPGMGSKLCGNYLSGVGCRWRFSGNISINMECRYHHISNMELSSPNVPINSFKILAGLSY
ncbi:MAG: hypothetical protein A2Y56_09830 [Candidatus Aminicenantes bacterium RBG_13_63_10]|nr:MAG: hypothetical protein A2Y56_09830 [Candidatus Aminicenantes bacterium RBG_13_63_10]